jgi:2-amino-4-hydroxy-6-hydroxymethyldihydropteridine diphosphokinase
VPKIFLSLGSNIDPAANLVAAVQTLARLATARHGIVHAVSSVWQSAPVGFLAQADFLNAAILIEADVSAEEVFQTWITSVEKQLDRQRDPANRNAPRTIDVDLSLYGELVSVVRGHSVPDPEILTRPFLALPLAELDPTFQHPTERRSLADIAAKFKDQAALVLRSDVDLTVGK